MEIRAVRSSDVASLRENCFTLNTYDEVRANVERALAQEASGEGISLVAVEDGRLLANLTVTRNGHRLRRHRAHLGGFVIHPDAQGSGLARGLTTAAAKRAQSIGCEVLEIEVRGGTHAEEAYRGLGFAEWGRMPSGLVEVTGTFDEVCLYLYISDWLDQAEVR